MVATAAYVSRAPSSSGLYDVLELILDKGLVIDAYVRVSLVGIEILTVDARVVVASVDTYLRFAEAANRLDLRAQAEENDTDMGDMTGAVSDGAKAKSVKGAASKAIDRVGEALTGESKGSDGEEREGVKVRSGADESDRGSKGGKRAGAGDRT